MSYCIICNLLIDNDESRCTVCLKISCASCLEKNENKCCFCDSHSEELEREIRDQFSLLAITKSQLISSSSTIAVNDDEIKPCPVCGVFIEKEKEDCSQIYCTICKTAWCWKTMKIVTEKKLIHNPHFFDKPSRNYSTLSSFKRRLAWKCLKRLDDEEYTYASDTFLYRVNFINGQIDVTEFKKSISDRFKLREKHLSIAKILDEYLNEKVSETECELRLFDLFGSNLKPGSLPYV